MSESPEALKMRLESLMKRYENMIKWADSATVEEYDRHYPEIKKLLDELTEVQYEF